MTKQPCSCHIMPPCSYCTGDRTAEDDDTELLREIALRTDNSETCKKWMALNPGKCIWCKKDRSKCYC